MDRYWGLVIGSLDGRHDFARGLKVTAWSVTLFCRRVYVDLRRSLVIVEIWVRLSLGLSLTPGWLGSLLFYWSI